MFDVKEITRAIKLITIPEHVYELRTVSPGGKTWFGYFSQPEKILTAAKKVSGSIGIQGVYLTINPVKPELLARTGGNDIFVSQHGGTTSDKDILRRSAFVIDIDSATRPSGISATDTEKETSKALAIKVKEYLSSLDWPTPLFADSGNGYHLRYNIDLPNDDESRSLIDSLLKSLAAKFNNGVDKIDTTLSNASRICKLYGTLSAKGADMPDRPHRINRIIEEGSNSLVPIEKLKEVIGNYKIEEKEYDGPPVKTLSNGLKLTAVPLVFHNWTPEEMEAVLDGYGIQYRKLQYEEGWKYQINCLFNEDHHSPDAYTMLRRNAETGKFYPIYKCSHDSCSIPRWRAFVQKLKESNPEVSVSFFEDTTYYEEYAEDVEEFTIPKLPEDVQRGDYLGDMAYALTKGTFIPIGFVRSTLKAILGAALDGKVGFPGEETLHMRHWNALISIRPESGKGVTWNRLMTFLKTPVIDTYGIILPKAGFFSSGEHAIKTLAMNDNTSQLIYFDEMKVLFEKGSQVGSTLFSRLLELYESKNAGVGSLTHSTSSFENVSLSMTGGFTSQGFEQAVSGKGVGGDGFLSRMVLEYSDAIPWEGDWDSIDGELTNPALKGLKDCLQWIYQKHEELKDTPTGVYIPIEDEDAKVERRKFQKWLNEQKQEIDERTPGAGYASRIESYFKRDLLIRALFTEEKRITKELTLKSIAWAKHQLTLRQLLWPIDQGGPIERFEKKIMKSIREHGPLSKEGIQKLCGIERTSGGFNGWNSAWRNILQSGYLVIMPFKNTKKKDVYGLRDAVWNREVRKWMYE